MIDLGTHIDLNPNMDLTTLSKKDFFQLYKNLSKIVQLRERLAEIMFVRLDIS